jgi:signal transduction histidine kinase
LLEAIRQTRELSYELSPAILKEFGLQAAVEQCCLNLTHANMRLRCRFEGLQPRLKKPLEIASTASVRSWPATSLSTRRPVTPVF